MSAIDLDGIDIGVSFKISSINLDPEVVPTIQGRDFVIANIQAPSGLRSAEDEVEEGTEEDFVPHWKEEEIINRRVGVGVGATIWGQRVDLGAAGPV